MADEWNVYDLDSASGKGDNLKEDVFQIISNLAPSQTPFRAMAKNGKAKAVYTEWLTDTLGAVVDNKNVEGATPTNQALGSVTRIGNYCQIMEKTAEVTDTVLSLTDGLHGRSQEMVYQLVKEMKMLNKDLEHRCVGLNLAYATGAVSTEREMASVSAYIKTNESNGGGAAAAPAGTGADAWTDGDLRDWTETIMKVVAQAVFTTADEFPTVLMLQPFHKRVFSGFDGVATKFKDAEDMRTIGATDIYVSDWGTIKAVPNRLMRTRTALLLNMSLWELKWLRTTKQRPLAKVGDSETVQIIQEVTLASLNEVGNAIMTDLNVS